MERKGRKRERLEHNGEIEEENQKRDKELGKVLPVKSEVCRVGQHPISSPSPPQYQDSPVTYDPSGQQTITAEVK